MTVGIVGYGWVGKAMHRLFPDAVIYDPYLPSSDGGGSEFEDQEAIKACEVVFVCVPTPNLPSGNWT